MLKYYRAEHGDRCIDNQSVQTWMETPYLAGNDEVEWSEGETQRNRQSRD